VQDSGRKSGRYIADPAALLSWVGTEHHRQQKQPTADSWLFLLPVMFGFNT
jgi:hypothetical protein